MISFATGVGEEIGKMEIKYNISSDGLRGMFGGLLVRGVDYLVT